MAVKRKFTQADNVFALYFGQRGVPAATRALKACAARLLKHDLRTREALLTSAWPVLTRYYKLGASDTESKEMFVMYYNQLVLDKAHDQAILDDIRGH